MPEMNWHQFRYLVVEAIMVWKKMTGNTEYGGERLGTDETELFAQAVQTLVDDHEGNLTHRETSDLLSAIEKKMIVHTT